MQVFKGRREEMSYKSGTYGEAWEMWMIEKGYGRRIGHGEKGDLVIRDRLDNSVYEYRPQMLTGFILEFLGERFDIDEARNCRWIITLFEKEADVVAEGGNGKSFSECLDQILERKVGE
jgi:hypothetical protein